MISIIFEEPYNQGVDSNQLEQAALKTLEYTNTPVQSSLAIVVGGDAQIQELNRQFMDQDHPTDVLSFPSGEVDPDDGQIYLGDVIISFPTALRQAKEGGHLVSAELRLLVVHGVLHLLGFDHADHPDKIAMWQAQADILNQLGNPITGPTQEE